MSENYVGIVYDSRLGKYNSLTVSSLDEISKRYHKIVEFKEEDSLVTFRASLLVEMLNDGEIDADEAALRWESGSLEGFLTRIVEKIKNT